MPRIKIVIAYTGTAYCGWQIQAHKPGTPSPPSIQGMLEHVIATVTGVSTRVHGSGRTDSGVHADGQVAHFDLPEEKCCINWLRAFNRLLPSDITVHSVTPVADDFHARYSATQKEYTYRLWLSRDIVPPHLAPFVWACGKLNVPALHAAALQLTGTHDFASFQNTGTPVASTVRTLTSIAHTAYCHNGLSYPAAPLQEAVPYAHVPTELRLRFAANGFLKQMVRNLTGLLVACGREKFAPADIPELITAEDRTKAPATAPPQGLVLTQVHYT